MSEALRECERPTTAHPVILVVDAQPDLLTTWRDRGARTVFADEQPTIHQATNPEQARALFAQHPRADVVLLGDPEGRPDDWSAVCRQFLTAGQRPPAIAISQDPGARDTLVAAGADGAVHKQNVIALDWRFAQLREPELESWDGRLPIPETYARRIPIARTAEEATFTTAYVRYHDPAGYGECYVLATVGAGPMVHAWVTSPWHGQYDQVATVDTEAMMNTPEVYGLEQLVLDKQFQPTPFDEALVMESRHPVNMRAFA